MYIIALLGYFFPRLVFVSFSSRFRLFFEIDKMSTRYINEVVFAKIAKNTGKSCFFQKKVVILQPILENTNLILRRYGRNS